MSIDSLLNSNNLPYSAAIMAAPLPLNFKVPHVEPYDESNDPFGNL